MVAVELALRHRPPSPTVAMRLSPIVVDDPRGFFAAGERRHLRQLELSQENTIQNGF